jgi:hypothetical protein
MLVLDIYKISYKLNLIKNNNYINNFKEDTNFFKFNFFSKLNTIKTNYFISSLDKSYILNKNITNYNNITNLTITPLDINLNNNKKPDLNLISFNFLNSLNLIKQERFFFKNSFLTEDISKNNQKYNETKKYINFFFNDKTVSDKNI